LNLFENGRAASPASASSGVEAVKWFRVAANQGDAARSCTSDGCNSDAAMLNHETLSLLASK
jgi:hypothetical protein